MNEDERCPTCNGTGSSGTAIEEFTDSDGLRQMALAQCLCPDCDGRGRITARKQVKLN